MEQFDREKIRRVWQRVQGTGTPAADPECSYISVAENLYAYKKLMKTASEQERVLLRQLIADSKMQLSVLQGIEIMEKGEKSTLSVPSQAQENRENLLRRCIGRTLQLAAHLDAVGEHSPFFSAYRHLSQKLGDHLCTLLALLAL